MVRFKLILLAAVTVLCLQFGLLTQAERQCDEHDGTFTLPEQILLFPISLFDNNKCASELEDVTDTASFSWYIGSFIEYVHGVFDMSSQAAEDFTSYVAAILNDWCRVGRWLSELKIPNHITSFIRSMNPAPFFSHYLTYIWNLDPTGSLVHVLTVYSMSLLPTCIPVSEQLANIIPSDVIATIMSSTSDVITTIMSSVAPACIEVLKNPSWALRVLTAVLIAVSLLFSLYRKCRNNTYWKQRQSMKYIKEHHLMCEIFDDEKCNCGGKHEDSAPSHVTDVALHYRMCESFDKLPCNCGGIVQANDYPTTHVVYEAISEPYYDSGLLIYTGTDVDAVSNADHTTGTHTYVHDNLGLEFASVATVLEQQISYCTNESTVTCSSVEKYPTNNVDIEHLQKGTESIRETVEFANLVRDHYQMCERFDGLQCNCGGRSLCSSETSGSCEKSKAEIKERNSAYIPEQNLQTTPLNQKDHKGNHSTSLENGSPNIIYFDYETYNACDSLDNCEHETDGTNVRCDIIQDGADIELYDGTEDLSESGIGAPVCNSSFTEESHYVTVNRDVSFGDAYAGGDGLSTFSTLTRRSPYLEHGLEDLVSDDSFLDAETSILDISSINNSLSFTNGDGVFEFAVMFFAQTAWRLLYKFWKKKFSLRNTQVREASPGLYLVRQKNKSKHDLSTSLYRNNSASVDIGDSQVDQGDQEEGGIAGIGVENESAAKSFSDEDGGIAGMGVENESAAKSCSDGNNNAGEANSPPGDENNEHVGNLKVGQQPDDTQQSGREDVAVGTSDSEISEDFKSISGKRSKFRILLEKAGLVNRNIWELGDDTSTHMNTDRSRLLAWAWSGMGDK